MASFAYIYNLHNFSRHPHDITLPDDAVPSTFFSFLIRWCISFVYFHNTFRWIIYSKTETFCTILINCSVFTYKQDASNIDTNCYPRKSPRKRLFRFVYLTFINNFNFCRVEYEITDLSYFACYDAIYNSNNIWLFNANWASLRAVFIR